MKAFIAPAGKYARFTTRSGYVSDVVVEMWMHIWRLSDSDLGGKRSYQLDYEVYDERCADPNNAVVDIYIGVQ